MTTTEQAIDAFWTAARSRTAPPPEWMNRLSREEAYRVQLGVLARHVAAGERQAGWKVGLTSKAMQIQQKVHEPVLGFLLASGEQPSGTRFQLCGPDQSRLRERALPHGRPHAAGARVTNDQAQAALGAMAPAFEIIEKRGDFAADLNVSLADNAQQRAYVTGAAVPVPAGFDLAAVALELSVNGGAPDRATGAEVLGTPAASIAWLANKLAELGLALEAGMKVMSGSFTRQYATQPAATASPPPSPPSAPSRAFF